MIFVTLGTNDKRFDRLLDAVERAIKEGVIQDRVVVQSGFTSYQSDVMEVHESFSQDEFTNYIQQADIVITHGGVGTIMTALKNGRTVLGAARLEAYHEHVNDHQIQILESFDEQGYLIYMKDLDDIAMYLEKAKDFKPATVQSNTNNMIDLLKDWIEKH